VGQTDFDVFGNNLHDVVQFAFNHTTFDPEDRLDQRVLAVHEPLAVGVSKTLIPKGRPWKFQVQHWNHVLSPDLFGPKRQIRFGISPVVALPWGK
jgi:hypothetical protein